MRARTQMSAVHTCDDGPCECCYKRGVTMGYTWHLRAAAYEAGEILEAVEPPSSNAHVYAGPVHWRACIVTPPVHVGPCVSAHGLAEPGFISEARRALASALRRFVSTEFGGGH